MQVCPDNISKQGFLNIKYAKISNRPAINTTRLSMSARPAYTTAHLSCLLLLLNKFSCLTHQLTFAQHTPVKAVHARSARFYHAPHENTQRSGWLVQYDDKNTISWPKLSYDRKELYRGIWHIAQYRDPKIVVRQKGTSTRQALYGDQWYYRVTLNLLNDKSLKDRRENSKHMMPSLESV